MEKLKPCPFCGAPAILREERESDGHESFSYYVVRCTGCKAHTNAFITGGFYGEQHTEQDAIAAWNRRTDEGRKKGRWKDYPIADGCIQCSVCGVLRMGEPSNYCPNCGARMVSDEDRSD